MLSNELLHEMNAAYGRVEEKCLKIRKVLHQKGLEVDFGWYNNHYRRDDSGAWVREAYPIPVIGVKGLCDIEMEFDRISVSTKLEREAVLGYDYEKLAAHSFEAYGVEDYLADYYHDGQTVQQLKENIAACAEKEFGFSFYFAFETESERIAVFIRFLKEEGFYY